jgi:hypothetical protein
MDTGLRKMIYIPNKEIWQGIQTAARMDGRSVSNYLVMLHQVSARAGDTKNQGFIDEIGSISKEAYANIETGNKPTQPDKFGSHRPKTNDTPPVNSENKQKIKKVVKKIPSIQPASDFFNPRPKDKK